MLAGLMGLLSMTKFLLESNLFGQGCQRAGHLAELPFRIQFQSLVQSSPSGLLIHAEQLRLAEMRVSIGALRVHLDRFLIMRNGAVKVARLKADGAQRYFRNLALGKQGAHAAKDFAGLVELLGVPI